MNKEKDPKTKRSNQKIITHEAQVLRFMRHSRGLSFSEAGKLVGISDSAVAHIEHGRMDISRARLETMIRVYGYSMDEFLEYIEGKERPINHRDECIRLLGEIDDLKLRAVHSILTSFLPPVSKSRSAYE
jgi:transcriptional regulator with XRE-family HTH domain